MDTVLSLQLLPLAGLDMECRSDVSCNSGVSCESTQSCQSQQSQAPVKPTGTE